MLTKRSGPHLPVGWLGPAASALALPGAARGAAQARVARPGASVLTAPGPGSRRDLTALGAP